MKRFFVIKKGKSIWPWWCVCSMASGDRKNTIQFLLHFMFSNWNILSHGNDFLNYATKCDYICCILQQFSHDILKWNLSCLRYFLLEVKLVKYDIKKLPLMYMTNEEKQAFLKEIVELQIFLHWIMLNAILKDYTWFFVFVFLYVFLKWKSYQLLQHCHSLLINL